MPTAVSSSDGIEVHVARLGLPGFSIVNVSGDTCRAWRDDARVALLRMGLDWPQQPVTVTLHTKWLRAELPERPGPDIARTLAVLIGNASGQDVANATQRVCYPSSASRATPPPTDTSGRGCGPHAAPSPMASRSTTPSTSRRTTPTGAPGSTGATTTATTRPARITAWRAGGRPGAGGRPMRWHQRTASYRGHGAGSYEGRPIDLGQLNEDGARRVTFTDTMTTGLVDDQAITNRSNP